MNEKKGTIVEKPQEEEDDSDIEHFNSHSKMNVN